MRARARVCVRVCVHGCVCVCVCVWVRARAFYKDYNVFMAKINAEGGQQRDRIQRKGEGGDRNRRISQHTGMQTSRECKTAVLETLDPSLG